MPAPTVPRISLREPVHALQDLEYSLHGVFRGGADDAEATVVDVYVAHQLDAGEAVDAVCVDPYVERVAAVRRVEL